MKSTMDRVPAGLALMAAAILTFTFTACSDDEDIENEVTYTYVFTEISASHPDFLEEKGKIENAFKSALGATVSNDFGSDEPFDYDMLLFFSPSGIKSLTKNFPDFKQDDIKIGTFGPTTAQAVRDAGLRLDIEAPSPGAPSMTAALDLFLKEQSKKK